MTEWHWVDGAVGAQVPVDDRGLNLADGVFETLRVEAGSLCVAPLHQQRMACGLVLLGFDDPNACAQQAVERVWTDLVADVPETDGSLRITVTRGSGPRGYSPAHAHQPRVVARFVPGLPTALAPARLVVADIPWPSQPAFAGLKLLARVEQILAAQCAQTCGADDALMLDSRGHCISSASGNLFFRRGHSLVTPALTEAGIAGTRRRAIIEHWAASLGFKSEVCPVPMADLAEFDEVFMVNSIVGVRSVASIAEHRFDDQQNLAAAALATHIHRDYSGVLALPTAASGSVPESSA